MICPMCEQDSLSILELHNTFCQMKCSCNHCIRIERDVSMIYNLSGRLYADYVLGYSNRWSIVIDGDRILIPENHSPIEYLKSLLMFT